MTKRFILIAGNIGVGKTSLAERLGGRMGWTTGFESVVDNPYLADFYADMRQWSFHLQVFFLGHRAQQHLALANHPQSAIADRSIYEDAHIFARVLHQLGNMDERDYESYRHVYDLIVANLPRPDLLLYLTASVPILIKRIRRRARPIEEGITAEYLALLDSYYEEWLSNFDLCPVLTIRTHRLDYVHHTHHLDTVIGWIEAKLAGREEVIID
jgi:deoxyadenosine/deoxycytidine kinase